ncbi:protein NETWORKED 4A isoform X1 [Rosa chinensis]|uniref:protein NETWORKED 4A isoform X1 n=1 Tax=Rosa chinensis TaxID=74649 RepID=UPI000D095493|nr:protein NETWORKED 4A isoform X1 [Rosa chinensis]XP_024184501.1 protein NETWORKED 4A isoform X1 [Rosa chinensis]XP_040369126.1 protein NETWORKED 4A isoform X1 [Rosa chinensis]
MGTSDLKKSDSCEQDNNVSQDGSVWLVENLEEMDQRIKQMLKLIKEDGDSLPRNVAEDSYKKPELIEEFQRLYRSLAGCYGHLAKEAHMQTPDGKVGLHKSGHQVVGLDMSPSSGGSSPALSLKKGTESSSSSSLESESESLNLSPSNYSIPPLNMDFDSQGWERIMELEEELSSMKEKLQTREADLEQEKLRVSDLQKQIAELESRASETDNDIGRLVRELEVITARLKGSDEENARLKQEVTEKVSEGVKEMQGHLAVAEEDIAMLEAQLDSERKHVLELQERIVKYDADLVGRDLELMELKSALHDAQDQFSVERADMQFHISGLSENQTILETRLEEWEWKNRNLEIEIRQHQTDKMELEKMRVAQEMVLQGEISWLKVELAERGKHVEAVNKDFDKFKLKYDMLMAEKDELNAKVHTLMANVSCRDDQIREMEGHLRRLHTDHEDLIAGSESARKLVDELKLRVEELQEEVNRQRVVISDGAEEKREAIRQLCFSLEHYRSGYKELHQAFKGHKWRAVAAA